MHALVELFTGISMLLFIEVVLVGSQRSFALPLHILDKSTEPLLDLPFAVRRLVTIPNSACDMPMPALVDVHLDPSRLTGRIPVVFPIVLGRELGSLGCQKQWNRLQIHLLAFEQEQVILKPEAVGVKANPLLIEVALQQNHRIIVEAQGLGPPPI